MTAGDLQKHIRSGPCHEASCIPVKSYLIIISIPQSTRLVTITSLVNYQIITILSIKMHSHGIEHALCHLVAYDSILYRVLSCDRVLIMQCTKKVSLNVEQSCMRSLRKDIPKKSQHGESNLQNDKIPRVRTWFPCILLNIYQCFLQTLTVNWSGTCSRIIVITRVTFVSSRDFTSK